MPLDTLPHACEQEDLHVGRNDEAAGRQLLGARLPVVKRFPTAQKWGVPRRHSSEDAAAGFSGGDLYRRRMLEAAAPAAGQAPKRAPGLLRLRSLSETGSIAAGPTGSSSAGPTAEQR